MRAVTYFATKTGYCVEVIDHGLLIDDVRVIEPAGISHDVLRTCALHAASELAVKHGVPLREIAYDFVGQHDEEALFG